MSAGARSYRLTLPQQIAVSLVVGVGVGWWINSAGGPQGNYSGWIVGLELVRDIFLHLIKLMIVPLVFGSVVHGIAGTGDVKKAGRIGFKALLYFELVTIAALAIGLLAVNLIGPGRGLKLAGATFALNSAMSAHPLTLAETVLHAVPTSLLDAMARNDVLQVVVFSCIFAIATIIAGDAGKPVLGFCASLTQVMFRFAGIVMRLAPFGVGAAMAVTVAGQGMSVLTSLGLLIFTLYFALVILVVVIFGLVVWIAKIPLKAFVRAVREPFAIAFATANSEAALPKAFENMERFGVPRGIVSFVLPAGYTFNLDGSTLYLAVASVFVGQVAEASTGIHFGLGQQLTMMLTLMVTSKGVAAVPRASLVVLIATLQSFNLPLEGAAMILGVDALLDMARTSVNVTGNCLASVVIARWEGEFEDDKARANFGSPSAANLVSINSPDGRL